MVDGNFFTALFLALVVLTTSILILMLVYLVVRLINRYKKKTRQQPDHEPALDPEAGRESRLSHRLSRQQIQQEHYEDLQQRYPSVPPSPSIELLPQIKTTSDDKASEWLERGVADEGVNVNQGDSSQKKLKMQQAMAIKPKKQLRWDRRD
jgi:hypothetical protein